METMIRKQLTKLSLKLSLSLSSVKMYSENNWQVIINQLLGGMLNFVGTFGNAAPSEWNKF